VSATDGTIDYLRNLVHRYTAVVLGSNKRYLFDARLAPLLAQEGLTSLDQLVVRLLNPGSEVLRRRVIEAMTTHETSFFRDQPVFETLATRILPALVEARRSERTLCIWSAGSSTGQELYSVATLIEEAGLRDAGWEVRLIGTDLSAEVVDRARRGRYTDMEVKRGVDQARLARWFHRVGHDWQLDDRLRRMTEFHVMNLLDPWDHVPMCDLVLLRNVLIYFDEESRRSVLSRVARVLRSPSGRLVLGAVESAFNVPEHLAEISSASIIYYRPR
jgi:chemotaxis protein methyltransferase CheR